MENIQSEYNMAFSYLNRLNSLFYYANAMAMELNAHGWFHILLALYRELSPYLKPEELEKKDKTITAINSLIAKNNKRMSRTGTQEISSELYKELHSFELFIREVLRRTGLQMRMENDPSKALQ